MVRPLYNLRNRNHRARRHDRRRHHLRIHANCVFESTEGSGRFSINSIISPDDGLTWSNRQGVYTAPPDRNAGAPQIINVGGTLVVSFITDEDFTISDADYTPRTSAKVMLSCDQGLTWGGKLTVGKMISLCSGLVQLDESNLLMMFDHKGVVARRLTLG